MTDTSSYHPISCEIHSELELAAMRNEPVLLTVSNPENHSELTYTAIIRDFIVQDKAEYAKIVIDGEQSLIRLDHIIAINKKP